MAVPSDLRRALRSLARRRTFAVTVVLTLALAFSIPTVVLSTVDRHFWRPLDLAESDRLFTLQLQVDDGRFSPLSHPEYVQLHDAGTEAFSLATFGQFDFTLVADGVPTRANVALVSDNFFTLLGAVPAHGRLLVPSDDEPDAAAAVLSHRAWTTQFGRDPDLVGRTVRLGPQVLTVVGIAANPLPGPAHEPDFWVPVSALSQLLPDSAGILLGPAARWLNTVGRLRLSTSRSEAAVLAALAKARLPADVAAARTEDWGFVARPINHPQLIASLSKDTRKPVDTCAENGRLRVVAGSSDIACSNHEEIGIDPGRHGRHRNKPPYPHGFRPHGQRRPWQGKRQG